MKMSDVKVGMRLIPTMGVAKPVTVTELTERGFKYRLDGPRPLIPRWGLMTAADGHEHFGFNGEAFFEPVAQAGEAGTAEPRSGSVYEHAVPEGDAP